VPGKEKSKNKKNVIKSGTVLYLIKYTIFLILLSVITFTLLYLIFILVRKKESKKEISSEPTQSEIFVQEEFDKEAFCEKEGPEMLEYIEKLQLIMDKAAKAMNGRGENLKNWPNWSQKEIENFVAEGKIIKETYQEIRRLSPPEKLTSLHQKMETALSFWAEGVSSGNEGFINKDDKLINDCIRLTSKGNDWIDEFKKEFNRLVPK